MPRQQTMDQSEFHDEERPKDHDDSSSNNLTVTTGPLDDHAIGVEDPLPRQSSFYATKRQSAFAKRDPFWLNLAKLAFAGAILVATLILILYFILGRDKKISSADSYAILLDSDWVETVASRRTTPFDPMNDASNCDFSGMNQPDTALQCRCGDTVDVIAGDIRTLYDEMRMILIPAIYGSDWSYADIPSNSCDARNQALLWLSSGNNRQNASDLVQRFILALLYYEWMGPSWDENSGWLTERNECDWAFVTCDTQDGRVVSLGFKANSMFGSIPKEISYLQHLKELSITENHLEGTIPSELMQLTSLQKLALILNTITGSVPAEISNLSNLVELRLERNELSGSLATEIGLVTSLQVLNLGSNTIGGRIPTEIGKLDSLRSLDLEGNRFSGSIPTEFGQLSTLESLVLNGMFLTGSIPRQLGYLKELETLQIAGAGLSGTIPTELGNAISLNRLDIKDNKLEGSLPLELGQMTELYFFAASNNRLTGTIPSEYGMMENMTRFVVFDNDLSGTLPLEFALMSQLEVLDLYETQMIGHIPFEICGNQDLFTFVSCYDDRIHRDWYQLSERLLRLQVRI